MAFLLLCSPHSIKVIAVILKWECGRGDRYSEVV
jgi:hypothetical protein